MIYCGHWFIDRSIDSLPVLLVQQALSHMLLLAPICVVNVVRFWMGAGPIPSNDQNNWKVKYRKKLENKLDLFKGDTSSFELSWVLHVPFKLCFQEPALLCQVYHTSKHMLGFVFLQSLHHSFGVPNKNDSEGISGTPQRESGGWRSTYCLWLIALGSCGNSNHTKPEHHGRIRWGSRYDGCDSYSRSRWEFSHWIRLISNTFLNGW